jgi:hypothetical protein
VWDTRLAALMIEARHRQRAPLHAPFPELGGHRQQMNVVLAVALQFVCPCPMATAIIGFQKFNAQERKIYLYK